MEGDLRVTPPKKIGNYEHERQLAWDRITLATGSIWLEDHSH